MSGKAKRLQYSQGLSMLSRVDRSAVCVLDGSLRIFIGRHHYVQLDFSSHTSRLFIFA